MKEGVQRDAKEGVRTLKKEGMGGGGIRKEGGD